MSSAEPLLLQTGRQALSLVAEELRARGFTSLIAPAVHCTTMTEPFSKEGMHIAFAECGADGHMTSEGLRRALAHEGERVALLYALTSALCPREETAGLLREIAARGGVLILDATHLPQAVCTPGPWSYRMVSFRKMLPVPDGAAVWGLDPARAGEIGAPCEVVTKAGLALMRTRAAELAGLASEQDVLRAEDAFEDAVEEALAHSAAGYALSAPSANTMNVLRQFLEGFKSAVKAR